MKKKITISLLFLGLSNLIGQSAVQKLPFYEEFNYPLGEELRPKGTPPDETIPGKGFWFYDTNASTVSPVLVEQPWENSKGLPKPKGNAIRYKAGLNDPLLIIPTQGKESGVLYASFLFKINSWRTSNEDEFFETWVYNKVEEFVFAFLKDRDRGGDNWSGTKHISSTHVFIKKDDKGDEFTIGISEGHEVPKRVYHPQSFKLGEDILIVVKYKYDLNEGTSYLWINPIITAVEPLATVNTLNDKISSKIKGSTPIMHSLDKIKINRNSESNTPDITIDELRIANTWQEVVGKL